MGGYFIFFELLFVIVSGRGVPWTESEDTPPGGGEASKEDWTEHLFLPPTMLLGFW